jgi:hypothetical protein
MSHGAAALSNGAAGCRDAPWERASAAQSWVRLRSAQTMLRRDDAV